jgi:hypothetical protein
MVKGGMVKGSLSNFRDYAVIERGRIMTIDGDYEGEFHTLFRAGTVRLSLQNGRLEGLTSRGTLLQGRYWYDQARGTFRYDASAHMPPLFEAITGLRTGADGRTVACQGEVTPLHGQARFSIDFAGRALDVLLRRVSGSENYSDAAPHKQTIGLSS